MREQSRPYYPRSSSQGGFASYVVIALLTVTIIILLSVFLFAPDTVTKFSQAVISPSEQNQTGQHDNGDRSAGSNSSDNSTKEIEQTDIRIADSTYPATENSGQPVDEGGPAPQTGNKADEFNDSASDETEDPNQALADNIDFFFTTLDSRDYIRDFQLEAPSNEYFPTLIQTLVNNPPVVSGETDDLFTILQNTAHFFRILGKKNILLLKGILDRERDTFEQTLADFYLLTDSPETLKNHFNLTIGQDELYAYAGFFLNTMGGRLYLFRRDSMSRMVVNFYAIQIIDRANRAGRNKYGIEIKDAIDNLILEIESSRIKLKMRDIYLDTLYDLKVRYQ